MKTVRFFLGLITIGFVLNACKTKCGDQHLTPAFVGFASADLDTIILKKYAKGSNAQDLIDTTVITNQTAVYFPSNDTTVIDMNVVSGENAYLNPNYDWQLYIPAQRLTVSITDIVSPQRQENCYDCGCINSITSFLQNGQLITSPPYSFSSFLLFISK